MLFDFVGALGFAGAFTFEGAFLAAALGLTAALRLADAFFFTAALALGAAFFAAGGPGQEKVCRTRDEQRTQEPSEVHEVGANLGSEARARQAKCSRHRWPLSRACAARRYA